MNPADSSDAEPAQTFYGRVKSYNHARGFGFLESPAAGALYGRDVFMRKEMVEELTLSRIASGSGPEAAVDRGEIFVRFTLKLNEAGKPEAEDVQEIMASDVPEDLLQLPPLCRPADARKSASPQGLSDAQPKFSKTPKDTDSRGRNGQKEMKKSSKGKLPTAVGDCRVLVGQNAAENWNLLASAKKKHWFFHLTDFSSCYVVLECTNEPSTEDKQTCAQICREHSQHKLTGPIKVDATPCGNVKFDRKRDAVGECEYKDEDKVEILIVD